MYFFCFVFLFDLFFDFGLLPLWTGISSRKECISTLGLDTFIIIPRASEPDCRSRRSERSALFSSPLLSSSHSVEMELKHNVPLISVSRKNSCLTVSIVRRAVSSSHRSFSPFDSVDTVQQIAHYTPPRRDSFAYRRMRNIFFPLFPLYFYAAQNLWRSNSKKGRFQQDSLPFFFFLTLHLPYY